MPAVIYTSKSVQLVKNVENPNLNMKNLKTRGYPFMINTRIVKSSPAASGHLLIAFKTTTAKSKMVANGPQKG